MNRHSIFSIVVDYNHPPIKRLDSMLRGIDSDGLTLTTVATSQALLQNLEKFPGLIFCAASKNLGFEQKLANIIQKASPDSVIVRLTDQLETHATETINDAEAFTVFTQNDSVFQHQLSFLLRYVYLKQNFRYSKHLLSITDLRSQYLVDFSREPIAYIGYGRHLYVNNAYLALFGFRSAAEALSFPAAQVVLGPESDSYSALLEQTQYSTQPINNVLMTFKTLDGEQFRAEVAFMPAVFRKQRCIQIHIHPLSIVSGKRGKQGRVLSHDPWSKAPLPSDQKQNGMSFRLRLIEALKFNAQPQQRLMIVDNSIRMEDKDWIRQRAFFQLASDTQRMSLDLWNVKQLLSYLSLDQMRHSGNVATASEYFIQPIGVWLLNTPKAQQKLFNMLKEQSSPGRGLIFALRYEDIVRHIDLLKNLVPELKKHNIELALDQVATRYEHVFELAKILKARYIRMSEAYGGFVSRQHDVPPSLPVFVETAKGHGLHVIIDGVPDIATMNILSNIELSYLQGSILDYLD